MFTNESYIKAHGGDVDAAAKELAVYAAAWRKGNQIGNIPLATLLGLAVKYPVTAKVDPEPVGDIEEVPVAKKKGRPAGTKNKHKPELANV